MFFLRFRFFFYILLEISKFCDIVYSVHFYNYITAITIPVMKIPKIKSHYVFIFVLELRVWFIVNAFVNLLHL